MEYAAEYGGNGSAHDVVTLDEKLNGLQRHKDTLGKGCLASLSAGIGAIRRE